MPICFTIRNHLWYCYCKSNYLPCNNLLPFCLKSPHVTKITLLFLKNHFNTLHCGLLFYFKKWYTYDSWSVYHNFDIIIRFEKIFFNLALKVKHVVTFNLLWLFSLPPFSPPLKWKPHFIFPPLQICRFLIIKNYSILKKFEKHISSTIIYVIIILQQLCKPSFGVVKD